MTAINTTTIECYTCHQPTTEQDSQQIRLLLPTGKHRNGFELLTASATLYECETCFAAGARADEHIYVVHTCGTTRTIGAATPQEAAALMLRDRGWRSTRSVAVQVGNTWTEYLDCELVNGALQFSEQVDLP